MTEDDVSKTDNFLNYGDTIDKSLSNKLTDLDVTIRELESRLNGGTIVDTNTSKVFVAHSEPLVSRDEIQKILSLIQSYANKVQLIGEGDKATFSKMKWRILTEINERLVSNPSTPPKTYRTTVLAVMSAMNIGNRLKDPNWQGLDGKGPYDVALFMGLPYYMEFVILSGLKHFAPHVKTISMARFFNPHASWSFPNLKVEAWNQSFETILNKLGGN